LIRRALALLGAPALALSFAAAAAAVQAAPAAAASACASQSSLSSSQSTGNGGTTITLTATFKDCNGNGIGGAGVQFAQTAGPCQATFSSTSAVTNAQGQATVTVTLPSGCPCQYTFSATAQGVTVRTTVLENGCFPATSASVTRAPIWAAWAAIGLGLLLVLGSAAGLVARRR